MALTTGLEQLIIVVDHVARLLPAARAHVEIVHDLLDHGEIAAGREHLAGAGENDRIDVGVGIDVAPDLGQLAVHGRVGCIHPPVLHGDAQHPGVRPVEFEAGVAGVTLGDVVHDDPLQDDCGTILWAGSERRDPDGVGRKS